MERNDLHYHMMQLDFQVHLYQKLLHQTLFSEENTFRINETHHIEKKDSPSGTALDLQKEIMSVFSKVKPQIKSKREGNNPGEHTVIIGMENETIEIKHKAEDRSIFALGALKGALWLSNKTSGFYSMSDIYSS